MRLHNGKLYPGNWEAIISVEEYEAVKAILEDPARYKYERGGLPKHLLSGMAYCGLCSNKLSVRKRYNNRIYYCSQNPPAGGCGKIQRVADKVEALITECHEEGPPRWQSPDCHIGSTRRRPHHVVRRVGSVAPPVGRALDEPSR
jgi:hypothetical protein